MSRNLLIGISSVLGIGVIILAILLMRPTEENIVIDQEGSQGQQPQEQFARLGETVELADYTITVLETSVAPHRDAEVIAIYFKICADERKRLGYSHEFGLYSTTGERVRWSFPLEPTYRYTDFKDVILDAGQCEILEDQRSVSPSVPELREISWTDRTPDGNTERGIIFFRLAD